jgi:hypothetical protein
MNVGETQAYESSLSILKADARRLFPMEIKGFPAATQRVITKYRENPNSEALDELVRPNK